MYVILEKAAIGRKSGELVSVRAEVGGQMIDAGTARLATAQEIARHPKRVVREKAVSKQAENRETAEEK
jgi:hypothetical protein